MTSVSRSPTLEVLALCLFVFLAQQLGALVFGSVTPLVALAPPLDRFAWTLLTSVYAHATVGHLLGNALVIGLIGLPLERVTTRLRYHAYFLGTGALSGVVQTLVTGTAVLGASGAAFALLGYALSGNRLAGGLLDRLPIPPRWQLVGFALLAGAIAVWTYAPGVALLGHFTGLFIGLVAGRLHLLRPRRKHNP